MASTRSGATVLRTTAGGLAKNRRAMAWSVGFAASSILTLNPATNFAIFDALKARALALLSARAGRPVRSLSAGRAFLLGSLSKVVATLVTYPLIRTKVMMQAAAKGAQEGEPCRDSRRQRLPCYRRCACSTSGFHTARRCRAASLSGARALPSETWSFAFS